MMRLLAVILMSVSLAGCLTANLGPVSRACPQPYKWTKAYADKLASEVEKLDQQSAVAEAMAEYLELRDWIKENCK